MKIIHALGPAGTSSHDAALELFPESSIHLEPNFDALFEAAQKNGDVGFVPIENSLHGSVHEVIDLLVETGLKIWRTYDVAIHYAFGASDLVRVKKIASHPQALAHCKTFLRKHFPDVEYFPVSSTAFAIVMALQDPTIGAIAREKTMKQRKLPVRHVGIERAGNTTRFGIIASKDPFPELQRTHMSIALHPLPKEDKPGLLHQLLTPFKIYDINMTRIENRPTGKKLGDYNFFVDFVGNPDDARTQKMLSELKELAEIRVLGEW